MTRFISMATGAEFLCASWVSRAISHIQKNGYNIISQKDSERIAIANGPIVNQCEYYMVNMLSVFVQQDKKD